MCVCVNIFPVKILGTDLFHVSGKTALVTGGSSGIGQFMAKCLYDAGAEVIVVGRREERLKQTLQTLEKKAHSAQYICLDLADDNAISALSDELSQRGTHPADQYSHYAPTSHAQAHSRVFLNQNRY